MQEEGAQWTPKSLGKIINKIDNLELKMCKMTTSDDRGREPPYTNLRWPLLDIEEETDSGEWLETLNWPYLTVIKEPMGLKEIMEGHKIIFRATAHEVDTVAEASDLREICQVLEEVEVDLIKVQMSADQESLVGQFQEMPLDVIIARNQATYQDSVKDAKMMKTD